MPNDCAASGDRDRSLEEVLADYLRAEETGVQPDPEALVAEHPDLADELRSFFRNRAALGRLIEPLQTQLWQNESAYSGDAKGEAPLERLRYFGDYELLEELGRGGMGVVYKAKQTTLNRFVALKLILTGRLASPQDVGRFRREADAAASLDHPNVTPIYEVGEHEGQQFFSMRLIEGTTLTDCIADLKGNHRRIATLLATLARAVHHAHQRGILHRDLKPANILMDADGEPHITDFGLARTVGGDSELTQSGAVLGTPSYMAPEQARGMRVLTTGVDIYSLGAVLYHALTGSPPFSGSTPIDILRQVVDTDPARPSAKCLRVNRDLETICLKCLDKEPTRRYESAAALAEDLERWLRHEPIAARASGPLRRVAKWVRRHPAATAIICLVASAAAAVTWQWRAAVVATRQSERELHRNRLALADRDSAQGDLFNARRWLLDVPASKRGWEWKCLWQSTYSTAGNSLPPQPAVVLGVHVASASGELVTLQYDGAVQVWDLSTLQSVRKWTAWEEPTEHYFNGPICHAFSKDGRFLAFSNEGHSDPHTARTPSIKVMDLHNGRVLFTQQQRALALALSPNGTTLYALCGEAPYPKKEDLIAAWNVATGQRVFAADRPTSVDTHWERLVLSGDGEHLYDLGARRLFSARDGSPVREISVTPDSANWTYRSPLAMSADGRLSAWALEHAGTGALLLLDSVSGKSRHIAPLYQVVCGAFSADGRQIALVVREPNLDLADVAFNEALPSFGPLISMASKSRPYIHRVGIHDVRDGHLIRSVRGFPGDIRGLAFFDDDRQLVAVGGEFKNEPLMIAEAHGDAMMWSLGDSGPGRLLAQVDAGVCDITVSDDSTLLAAGALDGKAYIWSLRTGERLRVLQRKEQGQGVYLAFAPTADLLAVSGNREVSIYDAASGEKRWTAAIDSWLCGRVTWTPDGRAVAVQTAEGTAIIEAGNGRLKASQEDLGPLVYSPDGRFAARPLVHDLHGELVVSEAKSGRELFRAQTRHASSAFSTGYGLLDAAFSPDSKVVVAVGNNGPGLLFSTSSGRPLGELGRRDGTMLSVEFSPDGTRIATGGSDGAVRLWDAVTGDELHAFQGHDQAVGDVAFSPDGTKLASGGQDGKIKVWEVSP
ncbi:MAG: WD40 repeat domain-containing serine/threonine-protein kinase [Pirellulales bacterium]